MGTRFPSDTLSLWFHILWRWTPLLWRYAASIHDIYRCAERRRSWVQTLAWIRDNSTLRMSFRPCESNIKTTRVDFGQTSSLFFLLWTCSRLKVWADIHRFEFKCVNLWVNLHYCNCRYCDEVVERRKTPLFEIDRAHLGKSTHVTVLSSPGWVTFTPTPTFLVSMPEEPWSCG